MPKREVPHLCYDSDKRYFYYLDGDLNFKKEPNTYRPFDLDFMYLNDFLVAGFKLYTCVLRWIERELEAGNSVSIVRQIRNNNLEECRQYNEVYSKRYLYLEEFKTKGGSVHFPFNTEYDFCLDPFRDKVGTLVDINRDNHMLLRY
jgi:hypothetical protein